MTAKIVPEKNISQNILQQYIIEKKIGEGAYGIVWKAYQRSNHEPVALKNIFDAFRNKEDAQRTFREVTYLKAFRGHPNIIQLLNIHRASNNSDIFLVFEYMNVDLHNYITSGNKLDDKQVRYITYQILRALKFIHSGNVVHRDLKPSNILLNVDCLCKIADFGLARSLGEFGLWRKSPLTDYVATRWYRAPEILLGAKRYWTVVDTWSLGCVLAEMVTGEPLFPGDSTADQLGLIAGTVAFGREEAEALEWLGAARLRVGPRGRPLQQRLAGVGYDCIDLAARLLRTNPCLRFSAAEALGHPFLSKFRNRRGETVLPGPVQPRFSDNSRLSIQDYRTALYTYEKKRYSNTKPILPAHIAGVNRSVQTRTNGRSYKPFSSDPEKTVYIGRAQEPTKYPPLTSNTCIRGNTVLKVKYK